MLVHRRRLCELLQRDDRLSSLLRRLRQRLLPAAMAPVGMPAGRAAEALSVRCVQAALRRGRPRCAERLTPAPRGARPARTRVRPQEAAARLRQRLRRYSRVPAPQRVTDDRVASPAHRPARTSATRWSMSSRATALARPRALPGTKPATPAATSSCGGARMDELRRSLRCGLGFRDRRISARLASLVRRRGTACSSACQVAGGDPDCTNACALFASGLRRRRPTPPAFYRYPFTGFDFADGAAAMTQGPVLRIVDVRDPARPVLVDAEPEPAAPAGGLAARR